MSIRKFREARSRRREEKKKRNRWTRYETIHGYREEGGRLRNLEDSRNTLESLDRRDSIRNMSSSQRAREREREREYKGERVRAVVEATSALKRKYES